MQIKADTRQPATPGRQSASQPAGQEETWLKMFVAAKVENAAPIAHASPAPIASSAPGSQLTALSSILQIPSRLPAFLPPASLVYGRDLLATNFGFGCSSGSGTGSSTLASPFCQSGNMRIKAAAIIALVKNI